MAIVEGPLIYFNTKEDTLKQIIKLKILIDEKLKDDFLNKTYINLKLGDSIY